MVPILFRMAYPSLDKPLFLMKILIISFIVGYLLHHYITVPHFKDVPYLLLSPKNSTLIFTGYTSQGRGDGGGLRDAPRQERRDQRPSRERGD